MDFLSTPMPVNTNAKIVDVAKTHNYMKYIPRPTQIIYKGKSIEHWAKIHNISIDAARRQFSKHNHLDYVEKTDDTWKKKYQGKTYQQWADKLGVSWVCIDDNIKRNGHLSAIGKKEFKRVFVCPFGKFSTVREMSKSIDLSYDSCYNRIRNSNMLDWYELKETAE